MDGVVYATASSDERDLLGSMLVASGTVTQADVEQALTLTLRHGGRLGEALVALGALPATSLTHALISQVRRRTLDLLHWREGEIAFVPGARSQQDRAMKFVPPFHLIAQGIREGYPATEIAEILAPLLSRALSPTRLPEVGLASLHLSEPEAAILGQVGSSSRLADLVERCVSSDIATRDDVFRALFIGLSLKLLELHP